MFLLAPDASRKLFQSNFFNGISVVTFSSKHVSCYQRSIIVYVHMFSIIVYVHMFQDVRPTPRRAAFGVASSRIPDGTARQGVKRG
jgi:hypothetical protein